MISFFLFCVLLIVRSVSASEFRYFTPLKNPYRYEDPIYTAEGIALISCVLLCNEYRACGTVSYQKDTGTCEVNAQAPPMASTGSTTGWTLIYPTELELTIGAYAEQSSDYTGLIGVYFGANAALNGDPNSDIASGSCSRTQTNEVPAYWAVGLTSIATLTRLSIFFGEQSAAQQTNLTILVASTYNELNSDPKECATYPGPPSTTEQPTTINCNEPVEGKLVKIINSQHALELCEVRFNM